jgi:hypothetical protein
MDTSTSRVVADTPPFERRLTHDTTLTANDGMPARGRR